MTKRITTSRLAAAAALALLAGAPVQAGALRVPDGATAAAASVTGVRQLNGTTYEINYSDGKVLTADFYGPNIVRLFMDPDGGIVRDPQATPPAQILTATPRRAVTIERLPAVPGQVTLSTGALSLTVDTNTGLLTMTDLNTGNKVFEQLAPVAFDGKGTEMVLAERPGEYFYGGGVQNGRFSHKGQAIDIVNTNSWTDGGVASPTPYYWTTNGYGVMWHTFAPGRYDFGAAEPGKVTLRHETPYLDMFVMADSSPEALLNDFYQLTGNPVLLPKFGFYEGHLNAYNRDYWTETETGGVLFEDGKRYKESQRDNGGIRESLNGELPGNYQFSARAVVDRYAAHDMPLGWVLPNDGYGAGYGQTSTLEGNVANLKEFGDYARSKGVEIGLWTQSDLHPKDSIEALLQRDIVREVRDAGVRVLKTDVAWVGWGYSFGLNGVTDVAGIMPYYGADARPFIISLDGWAGTQRYAGIWTGDQTGGEWEYIRFHIPTYIGSGLSGQPNICSDMDGIFGGKRPVINTRDFQWKTFTPMQLNMDGWGANEKYPHALGEPYASINRHYLKLKSELMPYVYTYAREAVDGKPYVRALFLDYPNDYTHSAATRYEYLFGPDMLIAPIYKETSVDAEGNDIRNGIYLPEGETWIDYWDGTAYEGGVILNSYPAPIWKLPVFVRRGAIIPMSAPHNNPKAADPHLRIYELWPSEFSHMTEYDDDGTTQQYLEGAYATTDITMRTDAKGTVTVTIAPMVGSFADFHPLKETELRINATALPKSVQARVGGKQIQLERAQSLEEFRSGTGMWYYDEAPELNKHATQGSDFASVKMTKNPQILVRLPLTDVTANGITVTVKGYEYAPANPWLKSRGELAAPKVSVPDSLLEAYTLTPVWEPVANADYYEIEFGGQRYTTILGESLLFEDLVPVTDYAFKVRAVNADGASEWTDLTVTSASNPLEHAIQGIKGRCSAPSQGGFRIGRLFDFNADGDIWHSLYNHRATPAVIDIDLGSVNTLDRFEYLPRPDAGNGTITKGTVSLSMDANNWTDPVPFEWVRSGDTKTFTFEGNPTARYIRMAVDEATGGYLSGRELFVFRVPGTPSYLQGDINKDGKVDENDLTSYMNYTGLRRGDSDFDYVSIGDINANGLIDSYDISLVGTVLGEGVRELNDTIAGSIAIVAPKGAVALGTEITVELTGKDMNGVNALSCAIPYDATVWEFVGAEPVMAAGMENLTYDRLHTDGQKVLYPTFVNIGQQPLLSGNGTVARLKFKAKSRAAFDASTFGRAILTDRALRSINQQ